MHLNGAFAVPEFSGYLLIGLQTRHEPQDLYLPTGQGLWNDLLELVVGYILGYADKVVELIEPLFTSETERSTHTREPSFFT